MRISYDKKADVANIVFQKERYEASEEIGEGVIVDYTKSGKIISIEIFDVSKRVPMKSLERISSEI